MTRNQIYGLLDASFTSFAHLSRHSMKPRPMRNLAYLSGEFVTDICLMAGELTES